MDMNQPEPALLLRALRNAGLMDELLSHVKRRRQIDDGCSDPGPWSFSARYWQGKPEQGFYQGKLP